MVLMAFHIFMQVLLESLPVSSSGHIFLISQFLQKVYGSGYALQVNESVDFLLHLPTFVVVGLFFFKSWSKKLVDFIFLKKDALLLAAWVLFIDLVTFSLYLVLQKTGKGWFPLPFGFLITGLLLLSLRWMKNNKEQGLSFKNGLALGVVQGTALLPGISRLGSTFVAARWLGFSRAQAFEYSLLIQFPLVFAAVIKGFLVSDVAFLRSTFLTGSIIASFLISGTISYFLLWGVQKIIERGALWRFCFYMIPLGCVTFLLL